MDFGSVLGAAGGIVNAFNSGSGSLKSFLQQMDSFGVQITSRYEAVFSAIPQSMFYISQINTPGMKQNVTQLYFDGKMVEIPQNFEYEHDFSFTVINDASGFIYTAMTNFVMSDSPQMVNSGYSMYITAIGDNSSKGASITLNGVRIKSIGGLTFNHQGGDVQTFEVNCSAVDFNYTAGILGAASSIGGALGGLTKGLF